MSKKNELDYLDPYVRKLIDKILEEGPDTDENQVKIVLLELLHSTFLHAAQNVRGDLEDYVWGKEDKLKRQIEDLKNG